MNEKPTELWLFERNVNHDFNCLDQLTDEQRAKFADLGGKRQSEFGYTRLLLNYIVTSKLKLNEGFESSERHHLPPDIPCFTQSGWLFSISHSARLIAITAAKQPCTKGKYYLGIDVESLNAKRSLNGAKLFCNDEQLAILNGLPDTKQKKEYYLRLWTQKEAFFKARHLPILNHNLKDLEISTSTHCSDLSSARWQSNSENAYQLSIYHNWPTKIEVRIVKCNNSGDIISTDHNDIVWGKYFCNL